MGTSGIDLCDIDVDFTHYRRDLLKCVMAQPVYVLKRNVQGVLTFVSCGVSADSIGSCIDD